MWSTLVVLLVLTIALYGVSLWGVTEGFDNNEGKVLSYNSPDQYYDQFYASFYDPLFHTPDVLSYERASFRELLLDGRDKHEMAILDVGCGTAPHACWFHEADIKYTGIDRSEGMLAKAAENCPGATFLKGDARQASSLPPKSFSDILILQGTIYEFQNPKTIAENAAYWLKPEGYVVVHAVHPNKFDPVVALASPFAGLSLQKYSDERVTTSDVFFDGFKYTSKFTKKPEDDEATWSETITFYDPAEHDGVKYREHKQTWTMLSVERLVDIFKSAGFTLKETVDLVQCGREYQYLLYFQK